MVFMALPPTMNSGDSIPNSRGATSRSWQRGFGAVDKYGDSYRTIALSTHVERDTDWHREYFYPDKEYQDVAVKNRNIMNNDLDELDFEHGKFFRADNYLEAVGIMQMLKEGIALDTVTRPISHTRILK